MKINSCVLLSGMFMSSFAWSQTVYDGYEEFHRTRRGIFDTGSSYEIGEGTDGAVALKGKRIALGSAKRFPGEFAQVDLGHWALAYYKFPFACVEGQSASASGTAVRYQSVYLIDMRAKGKAHVYKLSSLFGTCVGVRMNERMEPLFDEANYIYEVGNDTPVGATLREYRITQGKFVATGHALTTRFVEPGNVYKFEVVDVR